MKYSKFILNKVGKDRMNAIPFLLITILIIFIYIGNHRSSYRNIYNPMFSGENEIETLNSDIIRFQEEIDSLNILSENYKISNDNLNMAKNRLKFIQEKLDAIKNEDWNKYYENDLDLTNITLNILKEDTEYHDQEVIDIIDMSIKYNEYMILYNLNFDSRFASIQGISFMLEVINDFFPIMLVILLIFITSKMYCSDYIGEISIQKLLPYSLLKRQTINLYSGIFVGTSVILIISIISIICGTFGSTFGSFDSPLLLYTIQGADRFTSFISVIPQSIVLIFLSITFITNFVSAISKITRKNMICLLVSLGIIMGLLVVIQDLSPLHKYIHLFPTTYVNSLKVVSGELLFTSNNINVNFINGVIVLVITNTILFIINYALSKLRRI